MSFVSGDVSSADAQKFLCVLQNDFRWLAQEAKKKYPQIKESCEEAISKLNDPGNSQQTTVYYLVNQILYPLIQGCETKDPKIIRFCLGMMQRLVTQQVVDQKGSRYITDALWILVEHAIEEIKVLQTISLLLTTNTIVRGETLAKTLVLCFKLYFTKDPTVTNAACATIRQLVSLVFERIAIEKPTNTTGQTLEREDSANIANISMQQAEMDDTKECKEDAYRLFQDLVQLVNADQPYWLHGMTEMTRTFGLELLETILLNFGNIFYTCKEFTLLLKERVCALVIKLFSPNIKHRHALEVSAHTGLPHDKPYFPISMRLLRLVSILIEKYQTILVTECEIFLSLVVKFLDPDKPNWQRVLALEVIHRMSVKADLLCSFCKCYDMKDHSTDIFHDIVNSLGSYVQSLFFSVPVASNNCSQTNQSSTSSSHAISPGMYTQPGFMIRNTWLQLNLTLANGQTRSTYLDMLDKTEPPSIPDGYGISTAYGCLLDIVYSLSTVISTEYGEQQAIAKKSGQIYKYNHVEVNRTVHLQLIKSSWRGLLSALTVLIDASTDEAITENILKAIHLYIGLCGDQALVVPRDSFITTICKASLPAHYILSIFPTGFQENELKSHVKTKFQDNNGQFMYPDNDFRHQVVAVGTPLPTASLPSGSQNGPVMLTFKNLQCMRALLKVAHEHGSILGSSWHIVLATLQHLVWILGLKPSTGGSLQAATKSASETTVGIQAAVVTDLPLLSQMLSELFESSQYLDDEALHCLIDALCKLSQEAMELAYTNREPSLFAVAKLLETGLVNLPRIEVLWRPLTYHLLEVCQHRHIRMREWGVEAITYLVKAALQHKYSLPLKENVTLQTLLLNPLTELSSVPHSDVRQRQLECVLQILNGAGEALSFGWPSILEIIGAVHEHHGEALIRVAFQCLQLVITDFLPVIPWQCQPLCVITAAKFASQMQDLNISLTAVGLMWNISDFFNQYQDKVVFDEDDQSLILPDFPGIVNMPQFDKLWMCLYAKLGDLCVDPRPAVRKSAGQTLFSTISAHGSLLSQPTWQAIVWKVLFPLLDKVRRLSSSASSEKVDTSGNILIHHSRNTAQKQWAETEVLTLSGVSRVFNTKRELLQTLGEFPKAWLLLLEFIENSALSKNYEVSLAALKSFQETLYDKPEKSKNRSISPENYEDEWDAAWQVWLKIGIESTQPFSLPISHEKLEEYYIPSQAFLTALVQIFPAIFQNIKHSFNENDLKKLCAVLMNAVATPVQTDMPPYVISTVPETQLTPLHDGVLECMEILHKEANAKPSEMKKIIPVIIKQLLIFSKFCSTPPLSEELDDRGNGKTLSGKCTDLSSLGWACVNYIPFSQKALTMSVKLYEQNANDEAVIQQEILHEFIKALRIPLCLKYKCVASTTWKLAISSLTAVLSTGLKVARSKPRYFESMWDDLAKVLDQFLFPESACTIEDRGLTEIVLDETIDCEVIELLKEEVLPFSNDIPQHFILNVIMLLNKGSIHTTAGLHMRSEPNWKLREAFAKTCFETLLQFSLLNDSSFSGAKEENGFAGRLAVTALLHRFQEVVKKFNDEERQTGKVPLPRYRLSEISFVLKAVATLIVSVKKAPSSKVSEAAWEQLLALYPYLVDCITTTSPEVLRSLREALLQYADLLQVPKANI